MKYQTLCLQCQTQARDTGVLPVTFVTIIIITIVVDNITITITINNIIIINADGNFQVNWKLVVSLGKMAKWTSLSTLINITLNDYHYHHNFWWHHQYKRHVSGSQMAAPLAAQNVMAKPGLITSLHDRRWRLWKGGTEYMLKYMYLIMYEYISLCRGPSIHTDKMDTCGLNFTVRGDIWKWGLGTT